MSRPPAPRPGPAPSGDPQLDAARTNYLVALGLTFSVVVGVAAIWMLALMFVVFWHVAGFAFG